MEENMIEAAILFEEIQVHFTLLENVVANRLMAEQYSMPLAILSNASVGEHLRHIIELYQEMIKGYQSGVINYEKRERNKSLQNDPLAAVQTLHQVVPALKKADKAILLETNYSLEEQMPLVIPTSYFREVIYNIEHTIHHMALIRVGLASLNIRVPENFGVAPSTIKYRLLCAP
jgi:hypothetical protein